MKKSPIERRRWKRHALNPPEIGSLFAEGSGYEPGTNIVAPPVRLYVDILNRSDGGAVLSSQTPLEPQATFYLNLHSSTTNAWESFEGRTRWVRNPCNDAPNYLIGVELKPADAGDPLRSESGECREIPGPADFEFLQRTPLFKSIGREALCPILNCISHKRVSAGERFIRQNDPGECCFIIQQGRCTVSVEKNARLHAVGRMGAGEIVGEMAILTGEPRSAHVDADTQMQLWSLERDRFDEIAEVYPELRNFLTEILANRYASRTLTADRSVGKYIITDIIGQGGYSIVYKGVHAGLNMPVAIKMMKHDMAMNTDFLDKFHREAAIIAGFNHENIIKIYDFEELYRTVFIITEFLEGETLADLIQQQEPVPVARIIDFLLQICAGLQYAHERGIIHRDINSANMFVQKGGQVKILDFGLSCPAGTEILDFSGTLPYMSPEEIEGYAVDKRTDIYALGITAFELMTGRRPFPEDDLMALSDMHLHQDIPDPAGFRPGLPEGLRQFAFRACAKNPRHRYQDIQEAIGELAALTDEPHLPHRPPFAAKKMMTTLHLFYRAEHQAALNRLVEEFNRRAKQIGVDMKAADFREI